MQKVCYPYELRREKTCLWGFRQGSDTNQAVQPQKMAIGLKFWIKEEEGSFYLCSENKGADQLRSYDRADLQLFSHMQKAGFLMTQFMNTKRILDKNFSA